jgi:RNA polymerase sigma-70 factor, ECF subfamily
MSDKEKELFEDLALKHMDNLYSTAIRLVKNTKIAEDLVQRTFESAFRRFENYNKKSDFEKWMIGNLMFILTSDGYMTNNKRRL